jgi:plasmid maintenance system antidote protein VapI
VTLHLTQGDFVKLLDHIQATYEIKNDRQLADKLDISTPVISRIRNKKCGVSSDMMIRIHEVFGMSIADIKAICKESE